MKNYIKYLPVIVLAGFFLTSCVDEEFDYPIDGESEELFILSLDADKGGAYESETDYGLEIAFIDYFGELPEAEVIISFQLKDAEGFDIGPDDNHLHIKEVIYEIDDCTEGELAFTFNNDGSGTITLVPDAEIGMIESFEIVFSLPFEVVVEDGEEEDVAILDDNIQNEDDRGFAFEITAIESSNQSIAFNPLNEFEYSVLDDETITAEWVLNISEEEQFNQFKEAFSYVSFDLQSLEYDEVDEIKFEFEFEELAIKVTLKELEDEPTDCDLTEFDNKEIEIEAEYDADDGELELEGSFFVFNEDDGEIEDELDFILKAIYSLDQTENTLTITIQSLEDQDNFNEEAHFSADNAFTLKLTKD